MPTDEESSDEEWQFSVEEFEDDDAGGETDAWDDDVETIEAERTDEQGLDTETGELAWTDGEHPAAGGDAQPAEADEEELPDSPFTTDEPLEPGDIDLEQAIFVALGIAIVLVPILVVLVSL